jgi:hypothetical protein
MIFCFMKKSCDFAAVGYCGVDSIAIVPSIPLDSKVEIIESFDQGGGPAATAAVAAARRASTRDPAPTSITTTARCSISTRRSAR